MTSKGHINQDKLIEWIIILALLCFILNIIYRQASNPEFIQLDLSLVFFLFSILTLSQIIRAIKELKYINIYEDKIVIIYVSKLFWRTIYFDKIDSYNTFVDKNQHFLEFRTSSKNYRFNRSALSNGKELLDSFNKFSHKKNQAINQEITRQKARKKSLGFALLGLLIIVMVIFGPRNSDKQIEPKNLVQLNGHLQDEFVVFRPRLRSPGKYIVFNIDQYNEFKFNISSAGYHASDLDVIEDATPQDTIKILILNKDYELKIKKDVKPTFQDKHFRWPNIEVYGLQINDKTMFSVDDINKFNKQSTKYSLLWTCFGLIIGLELLRRARKAYL